MPTVHCDVGHAAMLAVVKLVEAPGGDNGFHLTPSPIAALGELERSEHSQRVRFSHCVCVYLHRGSSTSSKGGRNRLGLVHDPPQRFDVDLQRQDSRSGSKKIV